MQENSRPKILLAPMNIAGMPIQVVKQLKKRGYTAEQMSYTLGQGHKFGYEMDQEVNIKENGGRINAHASTLESYLKRDFDIFHFWNKSLFYEGQYNHFTGFDIPLIKARDKRIAYRFTGYDVRLPSWDIEVNPYSPFRYGYKHLFNEDLQKKYLDFLTEYVDQFLVQDPELQQFAPGNAKIIPRALNLNDWQSIGVEPTDVPLVVHAPSHQVIKGSEFIGKAVEELKDEGLKFNYKAISGLTQKEARIWYEKSDIIVDQILIGATGVLTLEAWALGKPCVLYLREDLFKPFYNCSELPVANANPDTIKDQLRKLIKDYEWRKDLSIRGRKTVEEYHDSEKVIDQYIETYQSMMDKLVVKPTNYADISYLKQQAEMSQKSIITINYQTRKIDALNKKLDEARKIGMKNLTSVSGENRTATAKYLLRDMKRKIIQRLRQIRARITK